MRNLMALLAGLAFGFGLLLSGMTNPGKVMGFLDLAGQWDPSLALVMAGAVAVAILPMTWARKQRNALLGGVMQLPTKRELDRPLVIGSLVFGMGWGVAGICPGPAVAMLPQGYWQGWVFFAAMIAGMLIFKALESRRYL